MFSSDWEFESNVWLDIQTENDLHSATPLSTVVSCDAPFYQEAYQPFNYFSDVGFSSSPAQDSRLDDEFSFSQTAMEAQGFSCVPSTLYVGLC